MGKKDFFSSEKSLKILVWISGSVSQIYGSEDPDPLPMCHGSGTLPKTLCFLCSVLSGSELARLERDRQRQKEQERRRREVQVP
jgi:hypothetical protein